MLEAKIFQTASMVSAPISLARITVKRKRLAKVLDVALPIKEFQETAITDS